MNLIDRDNLIEEYARSIATSLVLFGVDIREKFESATSMHYALEQAYLRGRVDESERMWIPCKERLPKEDELVLINWDSDDLAFALDIEIARYRKGNFILQFTILEIEQVIAWQPLPPKFEE